MLTHAAKADLVRRCELLMRFESMSEGIDSPARILRDFIRSQSSADPIVAKAINTLHDMADKQAVLRKIPVGPCTDLGDGLGLPLETPR